MDPQQVERLKQQQKLAIGETDFRISQLQKFKEDYENLHKRLQTLPDEVSHDIMVPFGKKAFMPGKLVHTNEVLVLLGEDWFAERSAKQAAEIVTRRIKGVTDQIKGLEKQKGLLEPRVQFTEEIQQANKDVVEIREEYEEEAEKKWKDEHRKNVKKAHHQAKQVTLSGNQKDKEEEKKPSADELWARLNELERLEDEQGQMEMEEDEEEEDESSYEEETDEDDESDDVDRRVRWQDEKHTRQSSLHSQSKIHFSHTPFQEDTQQGSREMQGDGQVSSDCQNITSPSDIYKCFYQPTSILKSLSSASPVQSEIRKKTKQKQESSQGPPAWLSDTSGPQAFTGEILERKEVRIPEPTDAPPRRVSKFKSQRMQKGAS